MQLATAGILLRADKPRPATTGGHITLDIVHID